jgi:hypothetical protein
MLFDVRAFQEGCFDFRDRSLTGGPGWVVLRPNAVAHKGPRRALRIRLRMIGCCFFSSFVSFCFAAFIGVFLVAIVTPPFYLKLSSLLQSARQT